MVVVRILGAVGLSRDTLELNLVVVVKEDGPLESSRLADRTGVAFAGRIVVAFVRDACIALVEPLLVAFIKLVDQRLEHPIREITCRYRIIALVAFAKPAAPSLAANTLAVVQRLVPLITGQATYPSAAAGQSPEAASIHHPQSLAAITEIIIIKAAVPHKLVD